MTKSVVDVFMPTSPQTHEKRTELWQNDGYDITRQQDFFFFSSNIICICNLLLMEILLFDVWLCLFNSKPGDAGMRAISETRPACLGSPGRHRQTRTLNTYKQRYCPIWAKLSHFLLDEDMTYWCCLFLESYCYGLNVCVPTTSNSNLFGGKALRR